MKTKKRFKAIHKTKCIFRDDFLFYSLKQAIKANPDWTDWKEISKNWRRPYERISY